MRKSCFLLVILLTGLVTCTSDERLAAGQNLAQAGGKTASTMAAYYDSLADIVGRQPALETFYQTINNLPRVTQDDFSVLAQQQTALRHRAQLARALLGFYDALQKLTANKTADNVSKAVDNLTTSLTLITKEPPTILGANLPTILNPAISRIAGWKQARSSRKAIEAVQTTLQSLEQLVLSEKDVYNRIILDRYFTLLNGITNSSGTVVTKGIAPYLLDSHSMTIEFLLQQLPELQGLPWSAGPVQDAVIKKAMQRILTNHLTTLKDNAQGATQNLVNSLQELTIEHQKLLEGRPLTLATVLSYQEQVQAYIDLWHKFGPKK